MNWTRFRHIATGILGVISAAGTIAGILPTNIGVPVLAVSAFATAVDKALGRLPPPAP